MSFDIPDVLPSATSLDMRTLWPKPIVMFTEPVIQGVKYQCVEQLLQQEEKNKKNTGVSLQARLQSSTVAFEVMVCQYLAAADRQHSHLRIISPFHTSGPEQIGGEEKIEIQNKTC